MPSSGSDFKQLRFEFVSFSIKTVHELLRDLGYLSFELASYYFYVETELCVEIHGLCIRNVITAYKSSCITYIFSFRFSRRPFVRWSPKARTSSNHFVRVSTTLVAASTLSLLTLTVAFFVLGQLSSLHGRISFDP